MRRSQVGGDGWRTAGTKPEEPVSSHIENAAEEKHHKGEQGRRSLEAASSTQSVDDREGKHSSRQVGGSARNA
jgi:hypothetical protein